MDERQRALDALGRLSTGYHGGGDSTRKQEAVWHELGNFLRYTDIVHAALSPAPVGDDARGRALENFLDVINGNVGYTLTKQTERTIIDALSAPPSGEGVDISAMRRVIAIAKAYKADETTGGNYKGANESNRRAIEYAEQQLEALKQADGKDGAGV